MKIKYTEQRDCMQCGVACLAMVCSAYGKEISIETISHFCFARKDGVSMLGISEAAQHLGFSTVAGQMLNCFMI